MLIEIFKSIRRKTIKELFKVDEKEMLTLWLADKILSNLEGEDELKLTAIETAKDELMDVNR